jgi:hypothetical protein
MNKNRLRIILLEKKLKAAENKVRILNTITAILPTFSYIYLIYTIKTSFLEITNLASRFSDDIRRMLIENQEKERIIKTLSEKEIIKSDDYYNLITNNLHFIGKILVASVCLSICIYYGRKWYLSSNNNETLDIHANNKVDFENQLISLLEKTNGNLPKDINIIINENQNMIEKRTYLDLPQSSLANSIDVNKLPKSILIMNNEQKTPERFLTEETENFFGSGIETLDSIEGTLSTVEKLNETEILGVINKIIE